MPATSDSYGAHVGVRLIITDGENVRLLRRANTGFADCSLIGAGRYLDEGETLPAVAMHEAHGDTGITIDPSDLTFAQICYHANPDGQGRVGVFITAARLTGDLVNAEPGKCSEISWHDHRDLPTDISYIRAGLLARTATTPSVWTAAMKGMTMLLGERDKELRTGHGGHKASSRSASAATLGGSAATRMASSALPSKSSSSSPRRSASPSMPAHRRHRGPFRAT